jgi:hypothetical protein
LPCHHVCLQQGETAYGAWLRCGTMTAASTAALLGAPWQLPSLAASSLVCHVCIQVAGLQLEARHPRKGHLRPAAVQGDTGVPVEGTAAVALQPPAWLRQPELLLAACLCALLLRASWAPLQSVSGSAPGLYRPVSLLLTCATTIVAAGSGCRLLFGPFGRRHTAVRELLQACAGHASMSVNA